MKKTIFLVIVTGLILGSGMVTFAQMQSMMGGEGKGMMMGKHANWHMMSGMRMCGMTGIKMIGTQDGGVIVMASGKLYKYDKDLNLKKAIEIPIDFEHIKKMRMKMKEMGMMGTTEEESRSTKP